MALRAGYKGFKKLAEGLKMIRPGILSVDNAALGKTFYTKKEQAYYGSVNLFNNTAASRIDHGVSMTVNSDSSVTFTGGPSTEAGRFSLGTITLKANTIYYLTGCPVGGGELAANYWLALYDGSSVIYRDTGNGVMCVPAEDMILTMSIRIPNNWTPGSAGIKFKPMVALVDNAEYAKYAQTNQYLTISADEQKSAINAIITAATGAADFDAFKTAMGAITPVTRSVAKIVEVEPEEIEEPKTTKKSTKKTTTTKEEV